MAARPNLIFESKPARNSKGVLEMAGLSVVGPAGRAPRF
jgi:hypothetical protein